MPLHNPLLMWSCLPRGTGSAQLEGERRAHEQTKSEACEARALAEKREKRIAVQDTELQDLRHQIEALRIEAATLTERAAHADELRGLVKSLQAGQGRGTAGSAGKKKPTKRRRTQPQG